MFGIDFLSFSDEVTISWGSGERRSGERRLSTGPWGAQQLCDTWVCLDCKEPALASFLRVQVIHR